MKRPSLLLLSRSIFGFAEQHYPDLLGTNKKSEHLIFNCHFTYYHQSFPLLYSAVNISLVLESKLTLLMKCVGHDKAKYMWFFLKTIKSKEREHHFNLPLKIIPNLST